ncbi:MAG: cell division protein FtsA [Patescibacteria group bacterium]|nr:cell division protein FtsA [Patescibacteria group bacterium]MDE1988525.1 cell division protein FtsA [Patescibacteria group bacterium]MDE2217867.1 cell division protein FtsA [Patescibacteria group bacterium]
MKRNITTGIDIGTYQIKVAVASNEGEDNAGLPNIIGAGFAESKGMRHGYIMNQSDVIKSLKRAIAQAEKTSGVKIREAYLSLGGIGLSGAVSQGSIIISKADSEITDLDAKSVMAAAEGEMPRSLSINRKIIQSVPISYKIDGKKIMGRPIGMKGNKFEVKALFIMCLEHHFNDLVEAVEKAGIEVLDVLASPIAASLVNLTKTQKIAGCVLANIGSETVSVAVFENNIPISLEIFPIGGIDITNDIALGLKIPLEEAERLKLGSFSESQYSQKKLDEIIAARLSDIFELIETHLKKIGRSGLLPAGIILTGGGSGIELIEDLAKNSLKLPSKVASVNFKREGKNEQIKDASWSVAYGLCFWGLNSSNDETSLGLKLAKTTKHKLIKWVKQFLP